MLHTITISIRVKKTINNQGKDTVSLSPCANTIRPNDKNAMKERTIRHRRRRRTVSRKYLPLPVFFLVSLARTTIRPDARDLAPVEAFCYQSTPMGCRRKRTLLAQLHASIATAPLSSTTGGFEDPSFVMIRIRETVWRRAALDHRNKIKSLLEPGLVGTDHPLMASVRKRFRDDNDNDEQWTTMLDPKHPVYNFLVEYYGLKGMKGPKRLARWSPGIGLLACSESRNIETLDDYYKASGAYYYRSVDPETIPPGGDRGIFLEGATPDDFGLVLHLKDAEYIHGNNNPICGGRSGILYRPGRYADDAAPGKATGILWYRSVLETTLENDPVLHCYGLHEWAMQYQPDGAPPPPSGKYQGHLSLRVSRETINQTVERKGLRCTHVDALRFFAPAAAPLNKEGSALERRDQLRLEQPACVHAHMDLLKIALKLTPHCDPGLLARVLEVALAARALDVGASPYDASFYGTEKRPVPVVPVETPEGRALYRELQIGLMETAEPVRRALLQNYNLFLQLSFTDEQLERAIENPSDERFARAEPGGLPWRKNLIDRPCRTESECE